MQSTPSLPALPGPLWPGVVAPDRALTMGQTELNCVLMLKWIVGNRNVFDTETVLMLNWTVWIRTLWLTWIAWNESVFENYTVYSC